MQRTISGKINVTFLVILCLIGASIRLTNAQCEACGMLNDAYCINTTHFHPCYDGINPTRDQTFKCPDGKECTDSENICELKTTIEASDVIISVCAGRVSCNECANARPRLACVSKTQYSFCVGGTPQPDVQTCGPLEICSVQSLEADGPICISECRAYYHQYQATCNKDAIDAIPPTDDAPNHDELARSLFKKIY